MPHLYLRIITSAVAGAALGLRHVFHVEIDAIAVGLLCLPFLPWLAPLIKSVEIPGVGKIELQEIKAQADEAKGAAQSAVQKADFAVANNTPPSSVPLAATAPAATGSTASNLNALVAEYNELRGRM